MKERAQISISPEAIITVILGIILTVSPFFFGGEQYWGKLLLYAGLGIAGFFWIFTTPRIIRDRPWRNPDLWLLLFVCVATFSLAITKSLITSLEAYMGIIAIVATVFIARSIQSEAHQKLFVRILVNGGAAMAAFGIAMFIYFANAIRLYAPFKNADGVGTALVVPLLLNAGLIATERGWAKRWYIATLSVLTLAFVMASTVSAVIGLITAAIVWFIVMRPGTIRRSMLFTVVVIIIGALGATYGLRQLGLHISPKWQQNAVAQLTGFGNYDASNSFNERLSYVKVSQQMANHSPLLGVGLGMWSEYFPQYGNPQHNRSTLAHGSIPQTLGELGWLGGGVFAALMVCIAITAIRIARKHRETIIVTILFAAMAGSIAAMMDIAWFFPSTTLTAWALIGIGLSPATTEMNQKQSRMIATLGGCIIAISLLAWGILRSTTSYLVEEAEKAGTAQHWVDAFATGGLAMRLLPNSTEELRVGLLQNFGAKYPQDKTTAQEYAERTIRHNPIQPAGYLLLGQILSNAGETAYAEGVLRQGLAQDPHWVPDLAVELSHLLILQKRYSEGRDIAINMIRNVGRGVPNADLSMSNLATAAAVAELNLNMRDAAHLHLQDALRLNPDNTQASNVLRESFGEGIQ